MMDSILQQFRGNLRLRVGLALILAISWLYGVLLLKEEVQAQEQRFKSNTLAVARLQAQLAEPEWPARTTTARALAVQLEGRLWQAPTPGLAQAALQDWLMVSMMKSGINNPQVSVAVVEEAADNANAAISASPTADSLADLWKLKAKINAEFNAPAMMDFLATLENSERQTVVRILTLRKEPSPRAELEVLAYFQKQKAPAAGAPPATPKLPGGLP